MPPETSDWRDPALLLDMLLAAEAAMSFASGLDEASFLASDLHQSAIIRKLEVLGEAAGKVSKTFCSAHPEIPWRQVTGIRHILIHNYGDVSLGIVWGVVTTDLPPLRDALRALVPKEPSQ